MSTTLTNKQTGSIIDESDIVTKTENGIVYSDKNCWNYVPDKHINESDDEIYYEKESVPQYISVKQKEPYFDNNEDNINKFYTEKAQYVFGFDFDSIKKRYTNTVASSKSSKEIDLGNFSYITIQAEEIVDGNSIIEYSITTYGTNAIPIIPENHDRRIKESLSYGCDTRFIIDRSSDAPVYYRDGIKIDSIPQDAESWEGHEYSIEYTAGGDPYKIIPPNNKIRILVTIKKSGSVKNIIVKKYGGELTWN